MKVIDIWFLDGIKDFTERKLIVGKNGENANKTEILLFETRISDGQIFTTSETGFKAEKIIEREKQNIIYTRQDVINSKNGKPFEWVYGTNVETKNKNKTIIKQYRTDFSGRKELIKTEIV